MKGVYCGFSGLKVGGAVLVEKPFPWSVHFNYEKVVCHNCATVRALLEILCLCSNTRWYDVASGDVSRRRCPARYLAMCVVSSRILLHGAVPAAALRSAQFR